MTDSDALRLTDLHDKSQVAQQLDQSSLFKSQRKMLQEQQQNLSRMQESLRNMAGDKLQDDFLLDKFKEAQAEISRSKLILVQRQQDLQEKEKQLQDSTSTIQQLEQKLKLTNENYEAVQNEFQSQTIDLRKRLEEQTQKNKEMLFQISSFAHEAEASRNTIAQNEVVLADKLQQIAAYQKQLEQAQMQLQESQKMLLELQNSGQSKEFNVATLKSQLEQCEKGKSDLQTEYNALKQLLVQAQENYKQTMKELNDRNIQLTANNQDNATQISALQQRLADMERAKIDLAQQVDIETKQNNQLTEQIIFISGERDRYKAKCDNYNQDKEVFAQKLLDLNAKMDVFKTATSADMKKLKDAYAAEVKRNEQFQQAVAKAEQDKSDAQHENQRFEIQIQTLKDELQTLQQKHSLHVKSSALVADENNKLVESMRDKLAQCEQQRQQLSEQITIANENLLARTSEVAQLKTQVQHEQDENEQQKTRMQNAVADLQRLNNDYKQEHVRRAELEAQNNALNRERESQNFELSQALQNAKQHSQHVKELQVQLDAQAAEIAAMRISLEAAQDKVERADALRQEIQEVSAVSTAAANEIRDLKQQNITLQAKVSYHFDQCQQAIGKNAFLHKMVENGETVIKNLNEKLAAFEKSSADAVQKKQVIDDLLTSNQRLNSSIEQQNAQRAKLEKQLAEAREYATKQQAQIEALEQHRTALQAELLQMSQQNATQRETGEELQKQIDSGAEKLLQARDQLNEYIKTSTQLKQQLAEAQQGVILAEQQKKQSDTQIAEVNKENARINELLAQADTEHQKMLTQISEAARLKDGVAKELETSNQKFVRQTEVVASLEQQIKLREGQLAQITEENAGLRIQIQQLANEKSKAVSDACIISAQGYQSENDRLTQQINGMRDEIAEYQRQIFEKDEFVTQLNKQMLEKTLEVENVRQLHKHLKALETELFYSKKTIENLIENSKLVTQMHESDTRKNTDFQVFQHALQSMQDNINQYLVLQDQLEISQSGGSVCVQEPCVNAVTTQQLAELQAQCDECQTTIEQLRAHNQELQTKLCAQTAMSEQLQREGLEKLNCEYLRRQQDENAKLAMQQETTRLNKMVAELSQITQHQSVATATLIMQQNYELQTQHTAAQNLQRLLDAANAQLDELSGQCQQQQADIKLLHEAKTQAGTITDELNEQLRCALERIEQVLAERDSIADVLETQTVHADAEIQRLNQELNELQVKAENDLVCCEAQKEQLIKEVNQVKEANSAIVDQLAQAQANGLGESELAEAQSEILRLQERCAGQAQELENLGQYDAVKQELEQLKLEIAESQRLLDEARASASVRDKALQDAQEQLLRAQNIEAKSSAYICELETRLSTQTQQIGQLTDDAQHHTEQLQQLSESVATLKMQLQERDEEIRQLNAEIASQQDRLLQSELRTEELRCDQMEEQQRVEKLYESVNQNINSIVGKETGETGISQKEQLLEQQIQLMQQQQSEYRKQLEDRRLAITQLKGILQWILNQK